MRGLQIDAERPSPAESLKMFGWNVPRNILRRTFEAYRRGVIRKSKTLGEESSFATTRSHDWNTLELNALLGLVPLQQRRLYRSAVKASYQAFLTAREGRLEKARDRFERAWDVFDMLDDGPGQLITLVALESNRAYLEYRLEEWATARQRLTSALDGSLRLERDFRLSLYQIHRIQVGHNLARMAWRRGRMIEAARLCGEAIAYLEGRILSPSYHHGWLPDRIEWVPRSLARAMALQVAREALTKFSCRDNDFDWFVFLSPLVKQPAPESTRFLLEPVWLFLNAVSARLKGDFIEYFYYLEQALPAGPRVLQSAFYAMMLDFTRVCVASKDSFAKQVASAVIRDSKKWKKVPSSVATALDSCSTKCTQSAGELTTIATSSNVEAGAEL